MPHTIYKLADGTRVPSVTTYLRILDKPAIIQWAWQCGKDGKDYKVVRDESADIGTLVHALICGHLKSQLPLLDETYTAEQLKQADDMMVIYLDWERQHKLEPILVETPLISEKFRYGGTPDFYGVLDGKRTLIDFKTTGGIYSEAYHQLAAYGRLIFENGHPDPEVYKILRVGKDGKIEEKDATNLPAHFAIFLACQQIYELRKTVNKKTKCED